MESDKTKIQYIDSIKEIFFNDYQYDEQMSKGEKELVASILTLAYVLKSNDNADPVPHKQWDYSIPPEKHATQKEPATVMASELTDKADLKGKTKKKPKYHPNVPLPEAEPENEEEL